MVIGIAMMAAMAPTVYGISEASNRRSQDKGNEQTTTKQEDRYQLLVECRSPSALGIQNAKVYLSMDGKMYISQHPVPGMVPFNGHFYSHPDFEQGNMVGFVTVSPETPPQLRWAFVDANTHQLAWGGAKEREGHISGPFGLYDDEGSISLNGCQRWIAVSLGSESNEEEGVDSGSPAGPDLWGLYFDTGENQSTDLPAGAERIEVELKMVRYPQRTRRRANPSMSPVQEAADSNG